jgi:predicted metal-dependent phosphoesterase TrpH
LLKGVLHVHSTFSDGDEPLERVVRLFRRLGMDFVAVSDHAEVFDDARMLQYVQLCESLSGPTFVVIPGLEFALHGGDTHILGYGVTKSVRAAEMEKLVDGIHEAGGIAVLAHPPAGSINMIGPIKNKLDGIEVWNGRYDGVRAPRADSLQLLRRVRSVNPKTLAFGGVDLHKASQADRPIYLEIDIAGHDRKSILMGLLAGNFAVRGGNVTIPSTGTLTFVQELSIAVKQPLCRPWAG